MIKKKKKEQKLKKEQEARRIILEATRAWDVAPVGTIDSAKVEALIKQITEL